VRCGARYSAEKVTVPSSVLKASAPASALSSNFINETSGVNIMSLMAGPEAGVVYNVFDAELSQLGCFRKSRVWIKDCGAAVVFLDLRKSSWSESKIKPAYLPEIGLWIEELSVGKRPKHLNTSNWHFSSSHTSFGHAKEPFMIDRGMAAIDRFVNPAGEDPAHQYYCRLYDEAVDIPEAERRESLTYFIRKKFSPLFCSINERELRSALLARAIGTLHIRDLEIRSNPNFENWRHDIGSW
jgi:hypothetical protein